MVGGERKGKRATASQRFTSLNRGDAPVSISSRPPASLEVNKDCAFLRDASDLA